MTELNTKRKKEGKSLKEKAIFKKQKTLKLILLLNLFVHWIQTKLTAVIDSQHEC